MSEDRLRVVVDFLNTLDERRFRRASGQHVPHDDLSTPRELKRFLLAAGLVDPRTRVVAADLVAAVKVRDGLRAAIAGEAAPQRLDEFAVVLELADPPRVVSEDRGVQRALAEIVLRCVEASVQGTWPRLKLCAAADCRYAFFDTGKNRLGRWCSMRVCGNREKTKTYRRGRDGSAERGSRSARMR